MDAVEPHFLRKACGQCVEERAGVLGAVRAKTGYFGNPVLIGLSGDRTAHNGDTDELAVYSAADTEPMAHNGLMMTMELAHKLIGVSKRHRDSPQAHRTTFALGVAVGLGVMGWPFVR